jgi:hypothetical protein
MLFVWSFGTAGPVLVCFTKKNPATVIFLEGKVLAKGKKFTKRAFDQASSIDVWHARK